MRESTDGELMQLIAQGNKKAFHEVYSRYSALVFGYSLRLLKNRAVAEDITQDVWIKTVRLAASYRGEGSLKGWLLKVTRNTALNHFRDNAKDLQSVPMEDAGAEVPVEDFERMIFQKAEVAQLKKALDELPEAQRVALIMWVSEKLSYAEIASEMNLSESAVKSLIFRARRALT